MLKEIRKQPYHIRLILMWLSVFVAFSIIGGAYFSFTAKKFLALLPKEGEEKGVAVEGSPTGEINAVSPFAAIGSLLKELRANISSLFDFTSKTEEINSRETDKPKLKTDGIPPRKLPLSE